MLRFLLVAAVVCFSQIASAQPVRPKVPTSVLDITPAEHCVALSIQGVKSLEKKGDLLIQKTKLDIPVRFSQIFEWGFSWLGIKDGIDMQAPASIFLVSTKLAGANELKLATLNRMIVLAIPIADWEKAAEGLEIELKKLKSGEVVKRKQRYDFATHCVAKGNHLYFAELPSVLKSVVKMKSIRTALPKHAIADLEGADILLTLGTKPWGKDWEKMVKDAEDPANQNSGPIPELMKLAAPAIRHLQYGLFTLRIDGKGDDGVTFRASGVFEGGKTKKVAPPKPVVKFLDALRGKSGASTLAGLPGESDSAKVFFAQGGRGEGEKTAAAAQELLREFANEFGRELGGKTKWFTDVGNATLSGVIGELWSQLHGDRMAIYTNTRKNAGAFSVVAVLEPNDADKFIKSLKELALFVSSSDPGLAKKLPKGVTPDQVMALIKDLASEKFKARRTAALKLKLLGDNAVPFLEKAVKSKDAEVAAAAQTLLRGIQRTESRRNQLLLKGESIIWEPKFGYYVKSETRAGVSVDVLKFSFHDRQRQKEALEKQLKELLGPDWQSARLAVVGKGKERVIVMLVGSRTDLFEQTIKNLQSKTPGLAGHALLGSFRKHQTKSERRLQFHLSFDRALRMTAAPEEKLPPPPKKPALSSFSVSIFKRAFRADINLPIAEMITLIAKNRRLLRF